MSDNSNITLNTKKHTDKNTTVTFKDRINEKKLLEALKEVEAIEKGQIEVTRYECFEDVLKDLD